MHKLDIIIFSKNRPAQLDLLLRSLRRFVLADRRTRVRVLVATTTPEFVEGYALVRSRHPQIDMRVEQNFRADTLELVQSAAVAVMFLVDDVVILRSFGADLPALRTFLPDRTIACLSLRLHPGIRYCYTKGRQTAPPSFLPGMRWLWRGQDGDWGYPMSLDGHVFRRDDLVPLLVAGNFHGPNSLECVLAERPLAQDLMMCQVQASLVNIPDNRVQADFPNRTAGGDIDELNRRFLEGEELDLDAVLMAYRGDAVHQEIALQFTMSRVRESAPSTAASGSALPAMAAAPLHPTKTSIEDLLAAGRTRVHLGCGNNYLPGYINIDLPEEGGFQERRRLPDILGDFTRMTFPSGAVEEIYSAHVFEHFQRPVAVGFLVRWHRWLRPGGRLRLEMPDIESCMAEFTGAPLERRLQLIRHLWGSHEAAWASHHEGWMPDYAALMFEACGYAIEDCQRVGGPWPAFMIVGRREKAPDWSAVERAFAAMCPGDPKLPAFWMREVRRIGSVN